MRASRCGRADRNWQRRVRQRTKMLILPPRRERLVRFKLPRLQSLADAATAMAAIIAAVATADLTLGEAAELAKLIGAFAKALEETAGGDSDLIEVWTDM